MSRIRNRNQLAQRNRKKNTRLSVQALESRRLLAGDIALVDSTISITGTDSDDVAEVYTHEDSVHVKLTTRDSTGAITAELEQSFDADAVDGVVFQALEGDDLFINDTALDSITRAGGGNDTVMGGSGNDILAAGSGDDVVLTGGGNDVVLAGPGDDLVIGMPASDEDTNTEDSSDADPVVDDTASPSDELVDDGTVTEDTITEDTVTEEEGDVDDASEGEVAIDPVEETSGDDAQEEVDAEVVVDLAVGDTDSDPHEVAVCGMVDGESVEEVEMTESTEETDSTDETMLADQAGNDSVDDTIPEAEAVVIGELTTEAEDSVEDTEAATPSDEIVTEETALEEVAEETPGETSEQTPEVVAETPVDEMIIDDGPVSESVDDADLPIEEVTTPVNESPADETVVESEGDTGGDDVVVVEDNGDAVDSDTETGDTTASESGDGIAETEVMPMEESGEAETPAVADTPVAEDESSSEETTDAAEDAEPETLTETPEQPVAVAETDNDIIFGGSGDDWLFGEDGNDLVFGGDSTMGESLLNQLISSRMNLG